MGKLPLIWTKHLKQEKREDFEKLLRNSSIVLSRLKEILLEKEASLTTQEMSTECYKDSGWPYLQAHLNGRKAEIKELKALLDFIG